MKALVDTNVLVRNVDEESALSSVAVRAMKVLHGRGYQVCLVAQVPHEFYAVATRPPANNGLGLSPDEACSFLDQFVSMMPLQPESAEVYREWRALVERHAVKGKAAHDARLVAAMAVHGVDTILTFNGDDFRRFPGVLVMEPRAVAAE